MNDRQAPDEYRLDNLKERAKELNCLYQVDEILNNQRLSLPEIFRELTRIIPSGWQFPEVCKARIVYGNHSYETSGFRSSPYAISTDIKRDGKAVGKVEVVYITEVIKSEEGYFLEKELKLIRTIADRIAQTILRRDFEPVLREWNLSKVQTNGSGAPLSEWMVIVDLMSRTDQSMLLHICRKMINYLCLSGIKEAEEVLWALGTDSRDFFELGELNYPSEKIPLGNLNHIREKTFRIAASHLSDTEIWIRLNNWIQEEKAYPLIKAVDRLDASVKEIVKVITRYSYNMGDNSLSYSPMGHWLVVALIRRFLSDKLEFINIARQHIEIKDFYDVVSRLIFPEGSHGKIGGKGAGLFVAQQILAQAGEDMPLLQSVKVPKTWYITTDEIKEFLHYNNLEELNLQKYKELFEIRIDYPNIIQLMKNCEFPEGIVKSLAMALDDFGDCPLIVRSSSLLEDQIGAAFSGKYKSLFLANQGSKQQRLEALMDAIGEVYASQYSPDSIQYRSERGLLDFQEEMGVMIQEVVGRRIGPYFLPLFAGVAFSNNEFRWSPRIKREDGLVRLVMGLGTRAVDRVGDDFPVLVSPGQPGLRVNIIPEEMKRYSPKKLDVINLERNNFETIELSSLLKEYGHFIPNIQHILSIYTPEYVKKPLAFDIDFERDDMVVTFDGLIKDTSFIKKIDLIQSMLKEKLGTPVDIEFASDGDNFYLLQCRPQSFSSDTIPAPIPQDLSAQDILFSANRYISNGIIHDISHIVYVDPDGYNSLHRLEDLTRVGKAVGMLNMLLPKQKFVLMGPGRWGSRGDIKLGVQVSYADINNTAALIEIARKKSNYVPELSFGTHFFQDLVESNIRYLPLYPDDKEVVFNELFFKRTESILEKLLPEFAYLEDVIRVIDIPLACNGNVLKISMNADLERALAYLTAPSSEITQGYIEINKNQKVFQPDEFYIDDKFWRWRYHMAERIAERLDMDRFGVKGFYVFGSTNNGTAGPGSDIDILIHFQGDNQQYQELLHWLKGWSLCLAEINYLKTGYSSEGLLDVHIVTDEDIARKTSFAIKINAVTDSAHPLKQK
ncbi:MAG: PEP/pyruvate-binding domain-containing protein [Syntrophomonadaceae bacterium]|nr:PEP/pyruvate-binding domain-containing protein [Syntrophomonadaceae bacterium]